MKKIYKNYPMLDFLAGVTVISVIFDWGGVGGGG